MLTLNLDQFCGGGSRRPLMTEGKVQIEMLSGLHTSMPIDLPNPANDQWNSGYTILNS